jgi:hypothetical protein
VCGVQLGCGVQVVCGVQLVCGRSWCVGVVGVCVQERALVCVCMCVHMSVSE